MFKFNLIIFVRLPIFGYFHRNYPPIENHLKNKCQLKFDTLNVIIHIKDDQNAGTSIYILFLYKKNITKLESVDIIYILLKKQI